MICSRRIDLDSFRKGFHRWIKSQSYKSIDQPQSLSCHISRNSRLRTICVSFDSPLQYEFEIYVHQSKQTIWIFSMLLPMFLNLVLVVMFLEYLVTMHWFQLSDAVLQCMYKRITGLGRRLFNCQKFHNFMIFSIFIHIHPIYNIPACCYAFFPLARGCPQLFIYYSLSSAFIHEIEDSSSSNSRVSLVKFLRIISCLPVSSEMVKGMWRKHACSVE